MTKKSVQANVVTEEVVLSSGITLRFISWGKEVYSSNRSGARVIDVLPEWITTRVELVCPRQMSRTYGNCIPLLRLESEFNEHDGAIGEGVRLYDYSVEDVETLRVALAMTETDYERFYAAIMNTREEVAACPTK